METTRILTENDKQSKQGGKFHASMSIDLCGYFINLYRAHIEVINSPIQLEQVSKAPFTWGF